MHETDAVSTLRRAATLLRAGGRMIVHEWHLESMLWPHTSAWPDRTGYDAFARASIAALGLARVQVDIGHRLGVARVDRGKLDDLARRL